MNRYALRGTSCAAPGAARGRGAARAVLGARLSVAGLRGGGSLMRGRAGCGRAAAGGRPRHSGAAGRKWGALAVGGRLEGEGRAVGASTGCGRRGLRRGAPTLLFLGLGFCRRLGRPPGRGRCGAVRRQRARMRAPAQVSVTIVQSGGAGRGRVWGPRQCTMHCR